MKIRFDFYQNRQVWMTAWQNRLQILLKNKKNKKRLAAVAIGFLLVIVIFSAIISHKGVKITDSVSLQAKRHEVILHELDDIHSVLHDIANHPLNSKQQQMALQSLETTVLVTQKAMMDVAKISDIQKVSNQIASVKDDIDSHMSDMKKIMLEGTGSKQGLDASVLPFHVLSVDVIAGQPYVSVEYASHISPLAIGDVLTGWRVVSADTESGIVEWINEQNQSAKVNVHGG